MSSGTEYAYGWRGVITGGRLGPMTSPVSAPPRTAGRGMHTLLAGAGLLALAWVCAMVYVVVAWVSA